MRNNLSKITLAVVLSISLFFAGCAATAVDSRGTVPQLMLPEKNIEILGLVYVDGEKSKLLTHQALLKAAEQKGGNGVANLLIDIERTTMCIFGLCSSGETWYGSALAIKYTNENIPHTGLTCSAK